MTSPESTLLLILTIPALALLMARVAYRLGTLDERERRHVDRERQRPRRLRAMELIRRSAFCQGFRAARRAHHPSPINYQPHH